ncbi:MAG: YicC family protein [Clostridiales bacterium]|jgi:uncharacterized protein (TIGR00255 family)|nr:YicC family protein [Clostridiales bacterium]
MVRSMTGYGRAQEVINGRDILVEIRSVNHRFYEFSSRTPRAYGYLEEKIKSTLQGRISRGKVEVSVLINNLEGKDSLIKVNKPAALGYITALREANEELNLVDDLKLSEIIRFPDIFNVQKVNEDEEEIWDSVKPIVMSALDKFIEMRETEGKKLKEDVLHHLNNVEGMVTIIEKAAPVLTENYRNRLYNKICDILQDTNIDEQRILTEVAIYSEKTSVDEETVRLHSHIEQFRGLMDVDTQVGRKLDFLMQEMNREINTIGSKIQDMEITKVVINLKSELEKIREQIQNIE